MKTYSWDAFVERQYSRLCDGADGLDVYLSVDETNGARAPASVRNVLRTNQSEILALGLADRYEKGSLLWWNPDYTHYHVLREIPDYDYYMFVEYDVYIHGGAGWFMDEVISSGAENVLHLRSDMDAWMWTRFHKNVYPKEICRGSLNCITVHTRRALEFLFRRRQNMSSAGDISFWPLSETFIPTELERGGFTCIPLSSFGDVSHYEWFPPTLENDLDTTPDGHLRFIHPVLDQNRYVKSLLTNTHLVKDFISPDSHLRRELKRFPQSVTRSDLIHAAFNRSIERVKLQLGGF
ncbi:hypothetical protein AA21952_1002 [Acetobacter oeni LMG 21952]|nr:hypothetical protein AA21952_1002 [Acetobacter oeni LMG 21952]